jgi:hypothetical protein
VKHRANFRPVEWANSAEGEKGALEGEMIKKESNFRRGFACCNLSRNGFHKLVKFENQ